MSNPTQAEVEQARGLALEMTNRARTDQAYMKQLVDDPVGTMLAAGLPPGAIVDILSEEGTDQEEVQGYLSLAGSSLSPSLTSTFGQLTRGSLAEGCSGAFSCLCASGGGCCYTGKESGFGPSIGTRSTPLP